MSTIPTSSTMYSAATPPETAPENPPESFAADGDATNNETVSMLALNPYEHTPVPFALGMPSISSVGFGTPSSGSVDLLSDAPDIASQQPSDRMSDTVNVHLSATNNSSETDFSILQVEDAVRENPDETAVDLIASAGPVHGHANLAMHSFLARRDDPFVTLIHPGNTRAYIDQSRREMAEQIEMMMAPFLGQDGS
ncbi:unnamed protein product [Clonostachys rosea]|uniref:Aflatoxin regulatory protein domain-containing protein n=1 Tax=Bionectria ochroleuca TaxID=29856 RepID=A0ABY6UEI9_BIOOC|nr:unnamed protein product [Clonostachys rosea]